MTVQAIGVGLEVIGDDGVRVREMRPSDSDGLGELYGLLSVDDTRKRFFSVEPPPSSWLRRWATIGERGGFGLVAVVGEDGTIVGDVGCTPLVNGNVELAVTVAPAWRGGLGSRLFGAALAEAARREIPNIEAEILLENQRMLRLVGAGRFAVVGFGSGTIRVVVSSRPGPPTWAPLDLRPRLLVEIRGGRWFGLDAAGDAGWQVAACPGPSAKHPCPAISGGSCALAAGADAVVFALPDDADGAEEILYAHRALHQRPVVLSDEHSRWSRLPAMTPFHVGSPASILAAIKAATSAVGASSPAAHGEDREMQS